MKTFRTGPHDAAIRYHDIPGDDPAAPLIFIHGLGCASSCDYPGVAGQPILRGRRMLLVDLLGSGFSDRPNAFGYTIRDHTQTIVSLVDGLDFRSLDLFGHSMGGAVAIVTARLLGDRVRRLVLSEPNLDSGGGLFSRGIAASSEDDYASRRHDELARESRASGNDIWAASLSLSAPFAVHRAATSLVAGETPSWREQLYALSTPRTVIFGERTLPHSDHERLPRDGVNVAMVPAAGHSMAWDNPAGLAAAIALSLA